MRAAPRRIALVAGGVVLLALAVLAAAVAVLSVRVQGESMQPTLYNHDRVLLRPFTGSGTPHRFALVVGRFQEHGERVVKRVIGLPGDRVEVVWDFPSGGPRVAVQPGGTGAWHWVDNPAWASATWAQGSTCCTPEGRGGQPSAAAQVPSGMLFLLGDNPAESHDSLSLGWAPADLVEGVVGLRVWPWRDAGRVGGRVSLAATGPD